LEAPVLGQELLAESRLLRVFLHRLGTPQHEDELVFELPDEPELMPNADVTDDGAYLVVTVGRGTFPETRLHVQSRETGEWFDLSPSLESRDHVIGNEGSSFLLLTDRGAERQRVVRVSLETPSEWVEVVPESEDALLGAWHVGGRLVCHYLHHAQSQLRVFSTSGEALGEIELPPHSAVLDLRGRPDDDLLHLSTTSFVDPGTIWSHDLATATTSLVWKADVALADVVSEQVFVPSDDGTLVPVFLVRRADVTPTGDVPVWLYGYGGFNVPMTPAFSVQRAVWVERGGVLAVANLRGGGEYGRAWYDAGRLANKQNVFDDFCSVARWLGSTSGWSRPDRIAINGGSNGGLLVGACLTQHPELFGAAVPEVGVLDALRFHKFTIGWAWTSDFGDPDDAEAFGWLRAYSPLHNISPWDYPAVLVMTGDRDDRVVPGHSFKFAAALQAAQTGTAPVLIRVETSAGHGAGKPTAKVIAERTDFLAFLELALGV
jgi:prolyl oligopeptidase